MIRRGVTALAIAIAAMCGAGCSTAEPPQQTPASAPGPLLTLTAGDIVRQLQHDGLEVGNPVEATDTDCAKIGCTQAIITDRFRLLTFPTTGAAQLYAAPRGMRQLETIAVGFAPVVPDSERDRYWSAITELAH